MSLEIGDKVPNILLKDQNGKDFSLYQALEKQAVVLFFYPKDNSPVCTKEVCLFRDAHQDFAAAGALVVGISSDSVRAHANFAQQQNLPYTLLSDPEQVAIKAFQVKNTFFITGRETFVIDPKGYLRYKYRSALNAGNHVKKALAEVKKINAA